MWRRRAFLGMSGALGAAGLALEVGGIDEVLAGTAAVAGQSPDDVTRDESYWREIQNAFTLDRTIINLNNGHHCPQPRMAREAVKRCLDLENQSPY